MENSVLGVRKLDPHGTSDRLCSYMISFLMGEIGLKITTVRDCGEGAVRKRSPEGVLPSSSESEGG